MAFDEVKQRGILKTEKELPRTTSITETLPITPL